MGLTWGRSMLAYNLSCVLLRMVVIHELQFPSRDSPLDIIGEPGVDWQCSPASW